MERRTIFIVTALAFLSLKLCALGMRSSRPSYTYPAYSSRFGGGLGSSDPYRSLDLYGSGSSLDRYEAARRKLDAVIASEREKSVRRSCAAATALHVEVGVTDPSVLSLHREFVRVLLPEGTWLPAAQTVDGLDVTLFEQDGAGRRLCLDATAQSVKAAVAAAKASSAPASVGQGAWVVQTTDDTAAVALLDHKVRESLKVKGPLVAFAPTDNVVVFADGARPSAVSLAAREAAKRTEVSGEQGCIAVEPLVFGEGRWSHWSPGAAHPAAKDLARYRVAARECEANQVSSLAGTVSDLAAVGVSHTPKLPELDATERDFSADRGATVTVVLDDSGVQQLVAPADTVIVTSLEGERYQMAWATFEHAAAAHLEPPVVAGTTVNRAFLLSGGLSVTDFASKKGVTRVPDAAL